MSRDANALLLIHERDVFAVGHPLCPPSLGMLTMALRDLLQIKAQYPLRQWHWALAFVYGRSSVNPMAQQQAEIVRLRQRQSRAASSHRSALSSREASLSLSWCLGCGLS